jgi:hypothetical protein
MAIDQVTWNPQEQGLREICLLLQEHRAPSSDQARIFLHLQQLTRLPDFSNYLAFILCRGEVSVFLIYAVKYILDCRLYEGKRESCAPLQWNCITNLQWNLTSSQRKCKLFLSQWVASFTMSPNTTTSLQRENWSSYAVNSEFQNVLITRDDKLCCHRYCI